MSKRLATGLLIAILATASVPLLLRRRSTETLEDPTGPRRESLTLLTYNVLGDAARAKERVPKLLEIIGQSKADVIALQEVVPWFLMLAARQEWFREYHATVQDGHIVAPGGQLFLSRLPIVSSGYQVLPGRQNRTVVVAEVVVNGRKMALATTHMESLLEDGPIRAQQLDAIFPLLEAGEDAVLLGDLNFGDGEEPETSRLRARFTDVWLALRPKEPGYTWDIERSDMAMAGSFPGEKSRRLDRILVRSSVWRPTEIRIIGDGPIIERKKDLYPSDHFGLMATLRFEPGRKSVP